MAGARRARGSGRRDCEGSVSPSESVGPAGPVQLGLRENLPQFMLLVLVNAFVGAVESPTLCWKQSSSACSSQPDSPMSACVTDSIALLEQRRNEPPRGTVSLG